MRTLFYFWILLVACSGCVSSQTSQTKTSIVLDKQGHRGCRGLLPENTIAAMKKAIDLGVTTLELDVVITKDKQVVLSHEPFFNHEIATKPNGSFVTEAEEKSLNIFQMDYEEVKRYDVGLRGHPRFPVQQQQPATKPLLKELIDSIKNYCQQKSLALPQFNIETKSLPSTDNIFHPVPGMFVLLLMDVIQEKRIEDRTIIQSFDFRTLQHLHQNHPTIKTAMLIEDDDKRTLDEQLTALGFIPTIYSPHYSLVTPNLVENCHRKGIKIIPWTVNEKDTIVKLVAMKADGIITDYPNLFNELGY
jgi:glycerophosphoryl diester phosphodiesterase